MVLIAPVVDPQHAGRHVAEHVVAQPNPKLTHSLPQEQVFDFITMGVNQSFARGDATNGSSCPAWRCATVRHANDWISAIGWPIIPRKCSAHMRVRCSSSPASKTRSSDTKISKPCCRTIPTPTFVTLDNAGHNAHIDQPEAVITLVREWVAHMGVRSVELTVC